MKIIEKINLEVKLFDWLNFDYLPDSLGHKFEVYMTGEISVSEMMKQFYSLFKDALPDFVIGQPNPSASWGDFCIDTWNVNENKYDYSIDNKSKETAEYIRMLIDNDITFEYKGFCRCLNWNAFLPIILRCILSHKAPYSNMLYSPSNNLVLYFHHTGSFGVYYREFNETIKEILKNVDMNRCVLKNYTDDKIKTLVG